MYLFNFKIFNEARLSDIYKSLGSGFTYDNSSNYSDEFIKYKTISKRINNNKIRLNIYWNDTLIHDLRYRIKDRTNLKSIKELNKLIDDGLDELYLYNYQYFKNGDYSLWFSEYDFSIIVNINYNNILIKTILHGQRTFKVKNIIELKSTI